MSDELTFNEYQEKSIETAIYPGQGTFLGVLYTTLGICGEAGEIAEKVKKALRDENGVISEERAAAIEKEVGDLLWYASNTLQEIKKKLGDAAEGNVAKLQSRKERGVLQGSGDDR